MSGVDLGVECRSDFPLLAGGEVAYLDSAASAQKPRQVIDAITEVYREIYANVHRGVYKLSARATERFEATRGVVAEFLGGCLEEEVIFTRGTTESVNLVAYSWGRAFLKPGDEILVTELEHHSNFVPWQETARVTGATIRYVSLTEDGELSLADFREKLSEKTAFVAVTMLANGLGVSPPVETIIEEAHRHGARVLVDAAQAVPHQPIDVRSLDADFLAFSAHKLYGPTGVGVLYGKKELLEQMPPFLAGGDMIRSVSVRGTTFADLPHKFEAGTPNIAGVTALASAIHYVTNVGYDRILTHEKELITLLEDGLSEIEKVKILGPKGKHHGLICFTIDGLHPHDIAQFMDQQKIAVRAGHHCAQPILEHFGIGASTRVSIGLYNTAKDVQSFLEALPQALTFFKKR